MASVNHKSIWFSDGWLLHGVFRVLDFDFPRGSHPDQITFSHSLYCVFIDTYSIDALEDGEHFCVYT